MSLITVSDIIMVDKKLAKYLILNMLLKLLYSFKKDLSIYWPDVCLFELVLVNSMKKGIDKKKII